MKILTCYIENFGSLHHMKCSLNDGLNSLNERNGWGKSTFAVFLRAMFYGLDNCRSSSEYNEKDYRKNLKPWQGGNFGGYVEFETPGKKYRVTRFFGDKQKDDSFELLDLETGEPSEDFSSSLGEELFGIDAFGYERSAYIPHNDLKVGTDDSINARLLGLLESDGDMNNYESAMKLLNDGRRELKKTGGRGRIDKEAEEKAEMEVRLRKALDSEKVIAEKKEKLAEAVKEKDELKTEREEKETELSELARARAEGGSKTGMMVFGAVMLILGILGAAAGGVVIMYFRFFFNYGCIALGAGGLFFIVGLILLIVRHADVRKNAREFALLQDEVTEKRKEYEAAFQREGELKQEIDVLSHESEDPETLRREIDRLTESASVDQEKLTAIERTMQLLSDARQSLSGHYMDRLRENFLENLKQAGIDEKTVVLDSSFNINIESYGALHSVMSESSGIRDLIYLSARFALIDALYESDRPCVILDDVMNNLDEERFEKAMKMTEAFSKKYQIIYLTCNAGRMPASVK